MPGINKAPAGLLDLLGLKNGGRNPDTLGTVLAPTFDLSSLYYEVDVTYVSNNTPATGVGLVTTHQVPQAEVWVVHNFTLASAILLGGEFLTATIAISTANNANWVSVGEFQRAIATEALCCNSDRVFLAGPGTNLGYYALKWASAGNIAVYSSVRYTAMSV